MDLACMLGWLVLVSKNEMPSLLLKDIPPQVSLIRSTLRIDYLGIQLASICSTSQRLLSGCFPSVLWPKNKGKTGGRFSTPIRHSLVALEYI